MVHSGATTVRQNCTKRGFRMPGSHFGAEEDEIPRRCACGISCRPRGSGQPLWDHAAGGPSDLLSVFVIRRPVSELPVRRTTKTASCLRSRLHGPKRVAERTRFELVVRNDPYVGLANRWFQPLTHLSGSHLAKLPPRGRTAKIRIFFELQGLRTKKDSRGGCPL